MNAVLDRLLPAVRTRVAAKVGERLDGYLALEDYGAIGEGRSVALAGADGSIDWWCVPNMDSPPLFDRLLDGDNGGRFLISPDAPFEAEQRYRDGSNVLETIFRTAQGTAVLTESLNSGTAGRLPWAELARRVECIDGSIRFNLLMRPGRRGDTVNPYHSTIGRQVVFNVGAVVGLFLHTDGLEFDWSDECVAGQFVVSAGERRTIAIVACSDGPLVVPSIAEIDERIDISHDEWRVWADRVTFGGDHRDAFVRSALALKLLLFSPSGAIAAAPTTSLPEKIGGPKNYDYRYAWVRDAGYTIKAFLAAGAEAEAKAAFSWLLNQLDEHGTQVCYALDGGRVADIQEWAMPGYRGSQPVVTGNAATRQHQHGVYGDIFETASRFVEGGNILDARSAATLSRLADECANLWRQPDSGIWELEDLQQYTMSKISCWQALARAVELADDGQLPTTCRERWLRERDRIADWIESNCWSDAVGSFVMYPGSTRLDASVALAVRFGFDGRDRLRATLEAIDRDLGCGPFHYRYSGAEKEEGCFLACSYWLAEAWTILGEVEAGRERLRTLDTALDRGPGILPEMVDPRTGAFLGNMPQGLSHLAHIMAMSTAYGQDGADRSLHADA